MIFFILSFNNIQASCPEINCVRSKKSSVWKWQSSFQWENSELFQKPCLLSMRSSFSSNFTRDKIDLLWFPRGSLLLYKKSLWRDFNYKLSNDNKWFFKGLDDFIGAKNSISFPKKKILNLSLYSLKSVAKSKMRSMQCFKDDHRTSTYLRISVVLNLSTLVKSEHRFCWWSKSSMEEKNWDLLGSPD